MFEIYELIHSTGAQIINFGKDAVIKGISTDSRTLKAGEAFIALKGENFDGHEYIDEALHRGAACVFFSQTSGRQFSKATLPKKFKKAHFLKVAEPLEALGKIANFHRKKFDIPVIAVTGSNGKTTTKEMIASVLSAHYNVLKNEGTKNNQIGLPMALLALNRRHQMAVLEIGTNHFGEVASLARICMPNIGIITNIGPSHLEYLGDLEGVLKEKFTLIEHLHTPRIAILNRDDALLRRKIQAPGKAALTFTLGIKGKSDFRASQIKSSARNTGFMINNKNRFTLHTLGYYNIYNALAAVAVGCMFGIEYKEAGRVLAAFDFPQSRLTLKKFRSIQFIDDTYNSNPHSLQQALGALARLQAKGRKILVLGDMLELGARGDFYHAKAGKEAVGVCDILVTVGELSRMTADAARQAGFDMKNIFTCNSCNEAHEVLFKVISAGKDDVVLVKGSRLMRLEEIFPHKNKI